MIPVDFEVSDITIPKKYVVCQKGKAFPMPLQHEFSARFGFNKLIVNRGDSALAGVLDEVADALLKIDVGD